MIWNEFQKNYSLTDHQLEQFKNYYRLLVRSNKLHNLTALTDERSIIKYHFEDSLALADALDINTLTSLADIGTGAGFPALPLKIKFPHLNLFLIEVTAKKREFLAQVSAALGLSGITLIDLDWRTFLRHTTYTIDLFCARASLHPDELVRMFRPSSPYKEAQLVYWAAMSWQPTEDEKILINREYQYQVGKKERRLIFFTNLV